MYILWHIIDLLYVYSITDLARTQMIDGSEGSHEVFDLLNHVAGLHADGATVLMIPSNKKNCLYEMIYRMR
jgi:predicted Zn-ribbon and HTH transcriptional regulator